MGQLHPSELHPSHFHPSRHNPSHLHRRRRVAVPAGSPESSLSESSLSESSLSESSLSELSPSWSHPPACATGGSWPPGPARFPGRVGSLASGDPGHSTRCARACVVCARAHVCVCVCMIVSLCLCLCVCVCARARVRACVIMRDYACPCRGGARFRVSPLSESAP